VPKLAVGPTHPVDCIMWLKWPGHEVDHSYPSSAKAKNEWSCTSTCHMPSCSAQGQLYIDLFVFQTSVLTNLDSVLFWYLNIIFILYGMFYRLRWCRGSVLAFGTQVRGFKPGRSRRIFKGEKIFSTPTFGGEVKPSVPCRRFAACKRSLELRGSRILRPNLSEYFSPTKSSTFRC